MRHILLTSTAAACLMLAAQVAQAQTDQHGKKHEQKVEHSQQAPGTPKPKQAAAHKQRPSTTGQATEEKKAEEKAKKDEKAAEHKAPGANAAEKANKNKNEAAAPAAKKQEKAAESKAHKNEKAQQVNEKKKENQASKPESQPNKAAEQNTAKPSTNTANEQKPNENKSAQTPNKTEQTNRNAAAPNNTTTNKSATTQIRSNQAANKSGNLDPQKRVRISETISRHHDLAKPVRNLSISVTVGERVPRRIHLHRLPREVVTIAPEYRGYDYFTTEEDVVIVSPRTHEIVSRIPRDVSRARAEAGGGSDSVVMNTSSGGGPAPCQVFRRTASGKLNPIEPSQLRETTGSGNPDRLAVKVQAPNGKDMPEVTLQARQGRIVAETDGSGCRIILEPGRTGR